MVLGSGSVIHGMHDEQDMRRMGALRKVMPITAATFIVGWLAIAGFPFFSGFFSKDEILLFAFQKSPALWVVGVVTALLTAFYMSRQVFMVFYGEAKWDRPLAERARAGGRARRRASTRATAWALRRDPPHESGWKMLVRCSCWPRWPSPAASSTRPSRPGQVPRALARAGGPPR